MGRRRCRRRERRGKKVNGKKLNCCYVFSVTVSFRGTSLPKIMSSR
jgi:hypothetical protein